MRKYFIVYLLVVFFSYGEIRNDYYDRLKDDQMFKSILDIKFPTIKEALYTKYNNNFYWSFFVGSSVHLNILYATRREQSKAGSYAITFDKKFMNQISLKDFDNLQKFFLFLLNNKKDNEGISFLFLGTFYTLMSHIGNKEFLPSLKKIFITTFSKEEAKDINFMPLLVNFVTFHLPSFNKEDQEELKNRIAYLLNLSFYLKPINLKYKASGLLYAFLSGIKIDIEFMKLKLRGLLTKEDKAEIKRGVLAKVNGRYGFQNNIEEEYNKELKRYYEAIKKMEWLKE